MSETTPAPNWGDRPVTRREALLFARNVAVAGGGIVLGSAAAEAVVDKVADRMLRGPHVSAEEWLMVRREDARDLPWHTFKGNRGWLNTLRLAEQPYDVAMLAVDREAMDAKAAELPSTARHAVVWLRWYDTVEVGVLPQGVDDVPELFPDKYVVGMGVAGGDLHATSALWVPESNAVVIPEGVEALGTVRTYDMAERYRGAVWV